MVTKGINATVATNPYADDKIADEPEIDSVAPIASGKRNVA